MELKRIIFDFEWINKVYHTFKFNLGTVNRSLSHSSIYLSFTHSILSLSFHFLISITSIYSPLIQTPLSPHKPECLSADTLFKKPGNGRLLWELAAWQLAGLATCPSVARAVLSVAAKCRASCVRLDVYL